MTIDQHCEMQQLVQPPAQATADASRLAFTTMDAPPPAVLMPVTSVMPLEAIQIQPNGHSEPLDLDGLTASVRQHGVLEPLVVSADGRLLAGWRRLEAARRAGLSTVPVRVCEISDERAAIEIGLIENIERTDLDPMRRSRCYQALLQQGATVEEIARMVGEKSGHVYQHLALLELHPTVQQAVQSRALSFTDARAFTKLGLEDQAEVLESIQSASSHTANGRPICSRQVRLRVHAQRVLRLAKPATAMLDGEGAEPLKGNYGTLFERENGLEHPENQGTQSDPLAELNALIAEMIAAAEGEDQVRDWARRLSRILKELRDAAAPGMPATQSRLW